MSSGRSRPDPTPLATQGTGPLMAVRELIQRWWAVVAQPSVRTFDQQGAAANWAVIWLSLVPLAVVEALGVAVITYGADAAAGYSSLPVGPKLHLPQTPLLPLAALLGSVAQFFLFSGLLSLSAHAFGGRGTYKTQTYLLALFWVPLMLVSGLLQLVPILTLVTSGLGALLRIYALVLCAFALASAHHLALRRAWAALLVPIVAGLLLGLIVLLTLGLQLLAGVDLR